VALKLHLVLGAVAALAGCALDRPAPPAWTVHEGPGFRLPVPESSAVTVGVDRVQADPPGGWWWYDVRVIDRPAVPSAALTAWAEETCRPVRWDLLPSKPAPDVIVIGGTCSIGERRFWTLASLETRGDRAVLTGMHWLLGYVGYEDVWVSFLRGPMSFPSGEPALSEDEVRRRIRAIPPEGDRFHSLPLPGGGVFSARVADALADVWQARAGQPVPQIGAPAPSDAP
jgi:hypothetical protein